MRSVTLSVKHGSSVREKTYPIPKHVAYKHGAFYTQREGKWKRLGKSYDEAMRNWIERFPDEPVPVFLIEYFMMDVYATCRNNAIARGIPLEITIDDARALARRSEGKCEVTGIPFCLAHTYSRKNLRPYRPSIDRIDSNGGYTMDNVRLVVSALNVAMGPWGEDVFAQLAEGYLRQNGVYKIPKKPQKHRVSERSL